MEIFDYGRLKAIKTDEEFRNLVPDPLGAGANATLIVWQRGETLILLIGYEVWPDRLEPGMSFPVITKQLGDRNEARKFIVDHHLEYRLSRLMMSYFRGHRCAPEKRPRGRPTKNDATITQWGHGKFGRHMTMTRLGKMYGVSRETLRLDMEFAHAVDQLLAVQLNGEDQELGSNLTEEQRKEKLKEKLKRREKQRQEIRQLLLGRQAKLTRKFVVQLAKQKPAVQVTVLKELLWTKQAPRDGNNQLPQPTKESKQDSVELVLPVGGPEAQAIILIKKLGSEAAAELSLKVLAKLVSPDPENEGTLSGPEAIQQEKK